METTAALVREPIVITNVQPVIDGGRFAPKREVGDWLLVSADIFREGHTILAAAIRYRAPGAESWQETALRIDANDRATGAFALDRIGLWEYTIEAWTDRWSSWLADTRKKAEAGQPIDLELIEGHQLVSAAAVRADGNDRALLQAAATDFEAGALTATRLERLMRLYPDRSRAARYPGALPVVVDRVRARFAAWYELFPRSQAGVAGVHGTFADVERRVPDIAALGFDVIYFPPIHPIGYAFRKGRNNALAAGTSDVGSPWAIGAVEGGHTAIHPRLGTLDDFRRLVRTVREHGMEVALDYAPQSSPDHPWIAEHPEWFSFRPDGSIRYAENPPKKYQDIVNFDFDAPGAQALWEALRDVFLFWIDQGVTTFRVDNPHTKPLPFWEWVIAEVKSRHPGTIFLAEAFTRPTVMRQLAKVGFSQSYTYFTWRNTKQELTDYMLELATETNEYLRPNFFTNTPDILTRYLQTGGRPAFRVRLVLAATLSSLYGIYSGFELCENVPAGENSEEYHDSEKYEIRVRDWEAPGNIREDIRAINTIRRENEALHEFENIRFYESHDSSVIFYGKANFAGTNHVFVAVNLDPGSSKTAALEFPTGELGIDPTSLVDVFAQTPLHWESGRARIELEPERNPAAIFVYNR
jgi:starch synthase (maltosyl-transferring)